MRKKQVEIFFLLYLTALVGFVVVSKERDKHDIEIEQEKNVFLRSFLQPVAIEFQRDTIWRYVSSHPGTTTIGPSATPFRTVCKVFDIGPEDSITVKVASVTHNNLLVSPRAVVPVGRRAFGDLRDRIVAIPLDCYFTAVGVYTVSLAVQSKRIHHTDEDLYSYRGITFPQHLIAREVLDQVERTSAQFTVIVEDTSVSAPVDVAQISIAPERQEIHSAVGFEETNSITVNLGFYNPTLTVIDGPGSLQRIAKDSRSETYIWKGPVQPYPYTVVVEARVNRKAGGKDIGRTSFTVYSEQPYLMEHLPYAAYSGETFETNIKVHGLEDDNMYSWELFETVGNGSLLSKISGKGPKIRYHIPTGFAGKKLVIFGEYVGRMYRRLDALTGRQSVSKYVFSVIDPPIHIELFAGDKLQTSGLYRFSVYRYSSPQYRYDQPLMSPDMVEVSLIASTGERIQTNIRMNSPGRFEFAVIYNGDIPSNGLKSKLTILAGDAELERTVWLEK